MTELVFVYGTLKKDGSNFHVMQKAGGIFKCKALTAPFYRLISFGGFPGMTSGLNCTFRIAGELFEITNIDPIDVLEGYPSFYDRKQICIVGITSPKIVRTSAWTYFITNVRPLKDYTNDIEDKNGIQWWNNPSSNIGQKK